MKDRSIDPVHEQIVLGVTTSAAAAVSRARETDTQLIIWHNNRIERIKPEDLDKINKKTEDTLAL
jgi:hypothetical protein